jgi:hypothetical protein
VAGIVKERDCRLVEHQVRRVSTAEAAGVVGQVVQGSRARCFEDRSGVE